MALLRKYQEAHQGLEALSSRDRRLSEASRRLFRSVAVIWALFQLALPSVLILDSIRTRAIHLAFALFLVFLSVPVRRLRRTPDSGGSTDRVPSFDWLLAVAGAVAALYLMLDWQGIALRSGVPSGLDVVMGVSIALILLEAARRVVGPALSIIVGLFALYAFFGPWMPEVLAFKGVSLRKFVTQISLSSEGIYGIPLGVSASVVYLFVLLGALLEKAGAGKVFIDMALALLGRFRGGPAKAAVASSGLMGMVSGSSIANIVTTGTFTIPLMKKTGYPPKKAAAIEVAASTDGQLMPPIMGAAAFIIAEYVNVPYIAVVKAAIIPALVSYAALFYITHLEALKLGITGLPRSDLPPFLPTFKRSLPFLLPVAVLLFELLDRCAVAGDLRPGGSRCRQGRSTIAGGAEVGIANRYRRIRGRFTEHAGRRHRHRRGRDHRRDRGTGDRRDDRQRGGGAGRRECVPAAADHRGCQPAAGDGTAHDRHLHRHGVADRSDHRRGWSRLRFRGTSHGGSSLLLLLRDPGRRYPAGRSGLLRRGGTR